MKKHNRVIEYTTHACMLGVFEYYLSTTRNSHEFSRNHTLKVIEGDAVEAKVDDSNKPDPRLMEYYPDKHTEWVRRTEK